MEGAERFLQGRLGVVMMVVENVDVVEPKPPQTLVEAGQKVFAGAQIPVGSRPHVPPRLGGDDQLITVPAEVIVENPGEIGFRAAIRRSVVIGQIEMGDAQIEGSAQDGALGFDGPVVAEVLP